MIEAERVISRLTYAQAAMRPWQEKMYRIRRVVAGDQAALFAIGGNNAADGAKFSRQFRQGNPDILISDFSEGKNNEILKSLMILVDQTCYSFPKPELRGVSQRRQVINNHWLKDTLDKCYAPEHGKIALVDFLMGGTGDLYLPVEDNEPVVRWADSLDIKFDVLARLPCDIKWKSLTVCEPLWKWVDLFKNSRSELELIFGEFTDQLLDTPAELEFYYDVESAKGNYMVLAKTSDTTYHPVPIYESANPHYMDYGTKREAYLPFESMFYMMLPSVKFPIGAAEKALPDQIGLWRQIDSVKETADNGPSFYEIAKGAFVGEEQEQEWMKAKKAGVAHVNELGMIKEHPALQVGPLVTEMLMMHTQGIQTQLGANNYSLGAPVSGVKYAREVNAMQASGSLTAGSISKANADCWQRFCKKTLCSGKRFSKGSYSFWVEGVFMEFGKNKQAGPINFYLAPEADIVIAEDSMRFMPQAQRLELAGLVLDRAMALNQVYPKGVEVAARRFYEAAGIENVDDMLQAAPPQMGMGVNEQGMPNGAGQAQVPGAAPPPSMPQGNQ